MALEKLPMVGKAPKVQTQPWVRGCAFLFEFGDFFFEPVVGGNAFWFRFGDFFFEFFEGFGVAWDDFGELFGKLNQ